MKNTMFPLQSNVDPDSEDFQTWADDNERDLHGASVEGCHIMALTPSINSVIIAQFIWEGEIYADVSLQREDAEESLNLAIEYYVRIEEYEYAAYAKSIIEQLNKTKNESN